MSFPKKLWPMPLPIVLLSGKNESGKTLLATTANSDPTRTCVYDLEHSSTTYNIPGLVRINVSDELRKIHNGAHKPVDLFLWLLNDTRSRVTPGKFDVVVIDPVSGELETGLADWVRANPKNFGATALQYEQMSGIMWGHAKAYYKTWLSEIASCTQTLFLIVHMGREWSGKSPTGRMKAKGLETLHELASLSLEMNRDPGPDGRKPEKPSARVVKSRLANIVHVKKNDEDDGEWVPQAVMPPRMPVATAGEIRRFMKTPIDYDKLSKEYLAVEEQPSEEEKANVRLQIAEAEASSARDRLALANAATENRAAQAQQLIAAAQLAAQRTNAAAAEQSVPPLASSPVPGGGSRATTTAPEPTPPAAPAGSTVSAAARAEAAASLAAVGATPPPPPSAGVLGGTQSAAGAALVEQAVAAGELPGMRPVAPGKLTVSMSATLEAFRGMLFEKKMDQATWDGILAKRGATKINDLTPAAAIELIGRLRNVLAQQGVPVEVGADHGIKS